MANVNRPTDTAVRDRDINNKLQLYGIFTAFSNGKVPSNKQIDVAMNSFLTSKFLASPSSKLSEEGRALIADLRDVIDKAKLLLLSKNEGNLLQDFIWQTQNLDGGNARLPGAPTDKDTAKQHGNEALDGLRTLGRLVLSNGQFRKLLQDATVLARDMAGDAAQSAANRVNPSEDRLNQIDDAAEDNTWHDVPTTADIKSQASSTFNKNKPFGKKDLQDAANKGADSAQAHDDPQQGAQQGASNAIDHLKQKASENIPDEHKDRAVEAKENAKARSRDYLNKKMPQERREQTIWRLKKMVVEIQGHEDYQQAIDTLLTLAETYGGHARTVTKDSKGTFKGAHDDDSLQIAEADLKTLIERFANSTSSDDFFDALNQMYRDAEQDPELRNWFQSLDRYIRKCLKEQGYILQDSATQEWNALYDKGHFLLRERYRDHTDRLVDELKFMADQFDQDPQNRAFAQSLQKLFNDLGHDADGKPAFKPHLIKDLTQVIIPEIFENTRYIPIPRIEVSDPQIDAIVENLVIESDNLFPNSLELGTDNYMRMGRRTVSNKLEHKVMIAGSGIQMDLKDVAYYVKKKEGFPSITDKGVMDVILAGEGFSFKLAARNAQSKDRQHFVVVENVTVKVQNLNIKLKQSNHKLLFAIAKPLLLKVMRPVIQKVIQQQIKANFEKADAYLWDVYQDVQKSAQVAKENPEEAQNIYQQWINAFQKKIAVNKEKAKEKAKNTTVNVAMTKQDSIFQNISLPGGVSTKATEYKQLAQKGDKWESPVFSLGSAKESTNIPRLGEVQRKPHNAASGGIRGGNHPNSNTNTGTQRDVNSSAYQSNTGADSYSSGQQGGYSGQQAGYNSNVNQYNQGTGAFDNNNSNAQQFGQQADAAFNKSQTAGGMTNGAGSHAANAARSAYYDSATVSQ